MFATLLLIPPQLRSQTNPFAGRWDITGTPQGNPRAGSVHPQDVKLEGTRLTLGVSRGTTWELEVQGDQ